MTASTYECENCHGVFETGWSDEEARAEAIANGFDPDNDAVTVCEGCHIKIMEWAKAKGLPPFGTNTL